MRPSRIGLRLGGTGHSIQGQNRPELDLAYAETSVTALGATQDCHKSRAARNACLLINTMEQKFHCIDGLSKPVGDLLVRESICQNRRHCAFYRSHLLQYGY
jgi:hypothetical protein